MQPCPSAGKLVTADLASGVLDASQPKGGHGEILSLLKSRGIIFSVGNSRIRIRNIYLKLILLIFLRPD